MSDMNNHLLSIQENWIKLSKRFIIGLFIYYGIIFVISGFLSGFCLSCVSSQIENTILLSQIIFQSFLCGLLGSSFYYFRKLYKSCIQLLVDSESKDCEVASIGVKAYFIGRPIMGAVISVVAILIIYSGLFFLVDNPSIIQDKFYIFISIFSFLFGFSNGKLIVKLDKSKDRIADLIDFAKGGIDK